MALKFCLYWDGWGPGTLYHRACTWTTISSSGRIQRNTKGLKITTRMWLGQISEQKDTKRPKSKLSLLRCQEQMQETARDPCTRFTTKGVGRPPKPALQPIHHPPLLSPHSRDQLATSLPYSPSGSQQGNQLLVFPPLGCNTSPSKLSLPEFVFWPLNNFCWLESKNPGWLQWEQGTVYSMNKEPSHLKARWWSSFLLIVFSVG